MLAGRRILLGVTGSIAAYKAAELARKMVRDGAEVMVVMTEAAQKFVAPLTFRTLTRNPVATSLFSDPASPVPHISLAQWAELVVIAPATADTLARTAQGRADDLLSAVLLDTSAPILWAPAMNTRMWDNPITRKNVEILSRLGHHWVEPDSGELACQEQGRGRLAEVEVIFAAITRLLVPAGPLANRKVMITAGPTREPWDGIRFLSNRSTGKMGYALAREMQRRGAQVTLISGPVTLETPPGVRRISVETAREMFDAAMKIFPETEVVIASAAVADFRPTDVRTGKLKKDEQPKAISLEANPDILKTMGAGKKGQLLVGFAAESEDIEARAVAKRRAKHCDLMVANQAAGEESAFAADDAKVYLVGADDVVDIQPAMPKDAVAALICDRIEKIL